MIANIRKVLRAPRASAVALGVGLLSFVCPQNANAALIYGATQQNLLISWDSSTPKTLQSQVSITGLLSNEKINGMDFRHADGLLYAITNSNRLYTIDASTGVATFLASTSRPIQGVHVGLEFDQNNDRIRIVTDSTQNVRVDAFTGSVATKTNVFYVSGGSNSTPSITNLARAESGKYYAIDASSNTLVHIKGINAGTMSTIGSIGLTIHKSGGFDIAGENEAYAVLRVPNSFVSRLYQINLDSGEATLVGRVGDGFQIRAMSIIPSAGSLALLACGLLVLRRPRGRKNAGLVPA